MLSRVSKKVTSIGVARCLASKPHRGLSKASHSLVTSSSVIQPHKSSYELLNQTKRDRTRRFNLFAGIINARYAHTEATRAPSRYNYEEYHQRLPLHHIVKVFAVSTPPNFFIPWQKKTSKESIGSGFVLKTQWGLKLLTNAHVVSHATTVRIRRSGSSQMYRAKVKALAEECDLAELEVLDEAFWEESKLLSQPQVLHTPESYDQHGSPQLDSDILHDDAPLSMHTGAAAERSGQVEVAEEAQVEQGDAEDPVIEEQASDDGLELGVLPELHSRVTVAGYPTGGDNVSVTRGVVSRIEPQPYAFSPMHSLLAIQIDAAINPGNSGGPVLNMHNKVVGVAFQSLQGADNIGYIIPTPVIQHFLEDVERNGSAGTGGFVRAGISTQILDNCTAARNYLKLPAGMSGILIGFVEPVSDANNHLKRNDVLLAIDNVSVANDGTVPFRHQERIGFDYLFLNRHVGDTANLTVWRDGQKLTVPVKMKAKSEGLVPVSNAHLGKMPSYTVYGGLVFVKLTLAYLSEYGEDWYNSAPRHLLHKVGKQVQQFPDEEIVLLSHVLVDDVNYGYSDFVNCQLLKVNGVEIRNLQHLDDILSSNTSEFVHFEADNYITIIMNHKEALEAASRIQESHALPALKSADFQQRDAERLAASVTGPSS